MPPGVDYYRRFIDGLLDGHPPGITLFHWDLPQALQDAGGWPARDTALRFADYAGILFDAFRDAGADWFTINEPKTHAFVGHWYGAHAPGLRDPDAAAAAVHHQLLAHGLAVQRFRASGANGRIGIALNLMPVYPVVPAADRRRRRLDARRTGCSSIPCCSGRIRTRPSAPGPAAASGRPGPVRRAAADGDLAVISTPNDLLAIQYYGATGVDELGNSVSASRRLPPQWQQIKPDGLYDLLQRLKRDYPRIPIVITENGMPDPTAQLTTDDPYRIDFLRTHFQQAARAIADGVPLEGHYVWSLLDNFEWAEGYDQRWGIVAVDFETQERTPKKSAAFYSSVIAANAVPPS